MSLQKDRVIIASDVGERDGIGIEVYRNDELVLEIFRDDTEKKRTVTLFIKDVSLELIEESIAIFKKDIPHNYQE